jgi:short-subunit dehydrogenase
MKDIDCALITGASSGLGEEFARQLAPRCRAMVLVARRGDRLATLAGEMAAAHDMKVRCFEADLVDPEQRAQLFDALTEKSLFPDLLINNAGMGDYGTFAEADWEKMSAMMRLNMEGLTHLTHLFLPAMRTRQRGAIINISSLASLLPIPDFAVYAATKAYVSSFSEALRIELRSDGISVLAVCPGPVHTEFGTVAARGEANAFDGMRDWFYVKKEQVVAQAIRAMDTDQARVYPGWQIALAAAGISLLPLALLRIVMATRPRRVSDDV